MKLDIALIVVGIFCIVSGVEATHYLGWGLNPMLYIGAFLIGFLMYRIRGLRHRDELVHK